MCVHGLRLVVVPQIKEECTTIDGAHGTVTSISWTDDGQILTVATTSGALLSYLAKIPNIVDACGLRVAHLSSLRELSISDTTGETAAISLTVSVEPSFVALGPTHVAVRRGVARVPRPWPSCDGVCSCVFVCLRVCARAGWHEQPRVVPRRHGC